MGGHVRRSGLTFRRYGYREKQFFARDVGNCDRVNHARSSRVHPRAPRWQDACFYLASTHRNGASPLNPWGYSSTSPLAKGGHRGVVVSNWSRELKFAAQFIAQSATASTPSSRMVLALKMGRESPTELMSCASVASAPAKSHLLRTKQLAISMIPALEY